MESELKCKTYCKFCKTFIHHAPRCRVNNMAEIVLDQCLTYCKQCKAYIKHEPTQQLRVNPTPTVDNSRYAYFYHTDKQILNPAYPGNNIIFGFASEANSGGISFDESAAEFTFDTAGTYEFKYYVKLDVPASSTGIFVRAYYSHNNEPIMGSEIGYVEHIKHATFLAAVTPTDRIALSVHSNDTGPVVISDGHSNETVGKEITASIMIKKLSTN